MTETKYIGHRRTYNRNYIVDKMSSELGYL